MASADTREEPWFIVLGVSEDEALAIAKGFGQESIVTAKGLVCSDGCVARAVRVVTHTVAPDNNYTRIPGGAVFTIEVE